MLRLYNTPLRRAEGFAPLHVGKASLYTCGPTVYNYLHVGNWVAYIRWDSLVRTLRANGYEVTRVMNITDVGHLVSDADEGEDKIQKGARREGVSMYDIAQRYTDYFMDGMEKLRLIMPQHITRATEYITEQIELVRQLEAGGFTYIIDDGVYFDTSKFPRYADFAHLDIEGMKAGARVSVVTGKRNPTDFALWKFDREGRRTEMVWDSPWGKGFPGWHIECSAMAMAKLGETIDIHTGGIDHIPVHHTNEIAQSEAVTGEPFAHFWLHANFLKVNGTKISKSLDNGFTLEDLEEKGYTPEAFKLFVLQSHYRTESNFTWENIAAAENRLNNWKKIAVLRHQAVGRGAEVGGTMDIDQAIRQVVDAMNDDLATPRALAAAEKALYSFEAKAPLTTAEAQGLERLLVAMDDLLGLNLVNDTPDIPEDILEILRLRQEARDQKDWKTSDEFRDTLTRKGVGVQDVAGGQIWYRV